MLPRRIDGRSDEGQSLVETALVLTLIIFILAGLVDLGRAFQAYIVMVNVGREAAVAGSNSQLCPNSQSVVTVAQTAGLAEAVNAGVTLVAADITVSIPTCSTGRLITVTIEHDLTTILGMMLGVNPIPLSYTLRMHMN